MPHSDAKPCGLPGACRPPPFAAYLLPLHHVQQVPKGRLLGAVKGQQGQRALHLRQTLPALLALLRQLRLGELQRCLCLALADQLNQVLLLAVGERNGFSGRSSSAVWGAPPR